MPQKIAGYVRCVRSRRFRIGSHKDRPGFDGEFVAGEVYAIETEFVLRKLLALRTPAGRHAVPSFVEATKDEYKEAQKDLPERPEWPLQATPAAYLKRNGDEAKWSELAHDVIAWDEEYGDSQDDEEDEPDEDGDGDG